MAELYAIFDRASKDTDHEHFQNWVTTQSDERDGGAAQEDVPSKSLRYRAYLYVDQAAVEGAAMDRMNNPYGIEFYHYGSRVVLINVEPPWPER